MLGGPAGARRRPHQPPITVLVVGLPGNLHYETAGSHALLPAVGTRKTRWLDGSQGFAPLHHAIGGVRFKGGTSKGDVLRGE